MLHCKVASLSWSQPSDQNRYEATQKNNIFLLLLPPHPLIPSDSQFSGWTSRPLELYRQGYGKTLAPKCTDVSTGPRSSPLSAYCSTFGRCTKWKMWYGRHSWKVTGNVPLATMRWWNLQSSHNEQICWHCRRQELCGIVSYTQMLKFKAKISSQLKWLKFCC